MTERSAKCVIGRGFYLQGISFLLVCALVGTFNFFNTPFSLWIARAAAFPEEEEHYAKDRSALVSAAQPSRRGTIRPKAVSHSVRDRISLLKKAASNAPSARVTHHVLTGAGIFQRC